MNILSGNFILLITIVIILSVLGINSQENNTFCQRLNEDCGIDEDCCSKNCQKRLFFFGGTCGLDLQHQLPIPQLRMLIESNMTCAYYKRNNSERVDMYKRFYINAVCSKLPPNTVINVLYQNQDVIVNINDLNSTENNENVLVVSEEAAALLGVTKEGPFSCAIREPNNTDFISYVKVFILFTPMVIMFVSALRYV